MDVYGFVNARKSTSRERACLVRDMYGKFAADMEAKGYRPPSIEEFVFFETTCYFWPVGTIVRRKGADDGGAYLVKGYDHVSDFVVLSKGEKAKADDIEVADIPEDVLAVARQQIEAKMAEKCPLKEPSCLA